MILRRSGIFGVATEEYIQFVIEATREIAPELGLDGAWMERCSSVRARC